MAVGNRMKEWRDNMRMKRGGYTQLTAWVPTRHFGLVKAVVEQLADLGRLGDDYRLLVSSWRDRRRAIRQEFQGVSSKLEVDAPSVGKWWNSTPIGGRVIGPDHTWIELTPAQVEEIRRLVQKAVDKQLHEWLSKNKLLNKIFDTTGVAVSPWWLAELNSEYGLINVDATIARPESDEDFRRNEAKIARDADQAAYQLRQHPVTNPHVYYYEGFHGFPSRCFLIHHFDGNRLLIALGHIEYGGTSPTNMFEKLATDIRRERFPAVPPSNIDFYDAWRDTGYDRSLRVTPVTLAWNKSCYDNPSWGNGRACPKEFYHAISQTYRADDKLIQKKIDDEHPEYVIDIPMEMRKSMGKYQKDLVSRTGSHKFVAHLHAYPAGEWAGEPCLVISDMSKNDDSSHLFTDKEKLVEAMPYFSVIQKYLSLPTDYAWDHPIFVDICHELGFDLAEARQYLKPQGR